MPQRRANDKELQIGNDALAHIFESLRVAKRIFAATPRFSACWSLQ